MTRPDDLEEVRREARRERAIRVLTEHMEQFAASAADPLRREMEIGVAIRQAELTGLFYQHLSGREVELIHCLSVQWWHP